MKIIIIDDDKDILIAFKRLMRKEKFNVVTTTSPQEALRLLENDSYALALSDQIMPEMDGISFLEKVKDVSPDTIRILITANANTNLAIESINRGSVYRLLTKPWNKNELLSAVRQSLDYYKTLTENKRLQGIMREQNRELTELNKNLKQARDQEMETGNKIQQTLLLGEPLQDMTGANAAAFSVPSRGVDGDFYDFFKINESCFDLIIGDVMGKGVPAALLGAAVKSQFLRALAGLFSSSNNKRLPEPKAIVSQIHRHVSTRLMALEKFITLCYARFDLKNNVFSFVDCGHTKTIHFNTFNGKCKTLSGENMPIGFSSEEVFKQHSISFRPGDLFVFYSDGVTEARDAGKHFFGEDRLMDLIRDNYWLSPKQLSEKVKSSVEHFSGMKSFSDDLTCVVVKITNDQSDDSITSKEAGFCGDVTELPEVRKFVKELCDQIEKCGLMKEEDAFKLVQAVNEAAANIIKHVYHNQKDKIFQVIIKLYGDRVVVRLNYSGESFDPANAPEPEFDGSRDSGFGLYIINHSVDEVNYFSDKSGYSSVEIIKRLGDANKFSHKDR